MAAATNLRSASNAGSTTTKNSTDGIKKKFCCTHPGCGKSFSRSEHLHRHALNHKDGNNTCLRCSAHFRRRDLLDRHMARHKEKDDEAGGEGLGILATRKRLWRDADGNIVNARRPSYTQESGNNKRRMLSKSSAGGSSNGRKNSQMMDHERRISSAVTLPPSPASMTRVSSAHSTIIVDTAATAVAPIYLLPTGELQSQKYEHHATVPWFHNSNSTTGNGSSTLLSPTASSSSSSSYSDPESSLQSESQSPAAELDTLYEDAWPLSHHHHAGSLPQIVSGSPPNTHLLGRESDYPASPGWGPQPSFQTFMGAIGEFEEPAPSLKDAYGAAMGGMYGWQNPWTVGGGHLQQTTLSRCRGGVVVEECILTRRC